MGKKKSTSGRRVTYLRRNIFHVHVFNLQIFIFGKTRREENGLFALSSHRLLFICHISLLLNYPCFKVKNILCDFFYDNIMNFTRIFHVKDFAGFSLSFSFIYLSPPPSKSFYV